MDYVQLCIQQIVGTLVRDAARAKAPGVAFQEAYQAARDAAYRRAVEAHNK